MSQIERVAMRSLGGNHGNELTGVHLVKKLQQYPNLINRESFETLALLGNLKAIEEGKRYIDKDFIYFLNMRIFAILMVPDLTEKVGSLIRLYFFWKQFC